MSPLSICMSMAQCIICGNETVRLRKTCSEEHKKELIRQNGIMQFKDPEKRKKHSDATKLAMQDIDMVKLIKENRRSYKGESHPSFGKERTQEWREKISQGNKGKLKGKSWEEIMGKDVAEFRRIENANAMSKTNAKLLKHRTSKLEKGIFEMLRPYGFKGNVKVGRYVVDMMNKQHQLIIEINGDYWHCHSTRFPNENEFITTLGMTVKQRRECDALRVKELQVMGYAVISFWESDIKDDPSIILEHETIKAAIMDWERKNAK